MANVNLKLNAERAFGKYLPTVYLKRVAVKLNESDADADRQNLIKIEANMSISFTKPDNIEYRGTPGEADFTGPSVEEFIRTNFDDLYLYSCMSPFEKLNVDVENERLYLKDLFIAYDNLDNITQENFTTDSPIWPIVKAKTEQAWTDKEYNYGMDVPAELFGDGSSASSGAGSAFGIILAALDSNTDMMAAMCYYSYPYPDDASAELKNVLGDFNTPGSAVHYIYYGDDGDIGPWNTPESVKYETLKATALRVVPDDLVDDLVTEAGEPDRTDPDYATTIGAFTDENRESENSFLYEHLHRILEDEAESATVLHQLKKIKLTDLIKDNPYGASLEFNKTYSSENQEIFSISNIKLEFLYEAAAIGGAEQTEFMLEQITRLFIISTIGLDMDERVSHDKYVIDDVPRELYNSFFGNITYEHVMSNNVVPNPYFENFIFSKTKLTYDGIPLQGLNGKLYADEPYSREDMVRNYDKLIDKYKEISRTDKTLATNLKNLSIILSRYSSSPNLIKNLKKYQRTYTDKSPSTSAGRFYAEFNENLVATNKRVIRQEQVEKRVTINATCIDLRPQRAIGDAYVPPRPNRYYGTTVVGGAFAFVEGERFPTDYDSCQVKSHFIPQNWSRVFRSLEFINVASEYGESETENWKRWLVAKTVAEYEGTPGVTEEMILAAVNDALEAEFGAGVPDTDGSGSEINQDMIVKNEGYFFFDYEKALYKTSALAQIVDLQKLCVFFGTSLPYSSYKVKSVTLRRKELDVDILVDNSAAAAEFSENLSDHTHTVEMKSYFSSEKEIPTMYMTDHKVDGNDYKYGKPKVDFSKSGLHRSVSAHNTRYSHVRYTYFDVTGTEATRGAVGNQTLHRFGMTGFSPSIGFDGFGKKLKTLPGIGTSILFLKAYRCMAFEFEDYMDDDVALRNSNQHDASDTASSYSSYTGHLNDGYRRTLLKNLNPWGEPSTHYDIEIEIEDNTMKFFNILTVNFINPLIEAWEEYYAYAEELCSFNKSSGEFNQFFIDAMIERYITNRVNGSTWSDAVTNESLMGYITSGMSGENPDIDTSVINFKQYAKNLPPWVAAAFLSAVVKEIFFNQTAPGKLYYILDKLSFAMSEIDPSGGPADPSIVKFVREMYSISPQKGNIQSLRDFHDRITPLIDIFKLQEPQMIEILIDLFAPGYEGSRSEEGIKALVESPREIIFNSTMRIDTPVAVGAHRDSFFADYLSRVRDGLEVDPIEALVPVHSTYPMGSFMNTMPASQAVSFNAILGGGGFEDMILRTKLKNWLAANGVSLNEKVHLWIRSLPDYPKWKRRFESYVSGGPPPGPGDLPTEMPVGSSEVGNAWLRIYFPKSFTSERIIDADPDKQWMSYLHVDYDRAINRLSSTGDPGKHMKVRWNWMQEPAGDYDYSFDSVIDDVDGEY